MYAICCNCPGAKSALYGRLLSIDCCCGKSLTTNTILGHLTTCYIWSLSIGASRCERGSTDSASFLVFVAEGYTTLLCLTAYNSTTVPRRPYVGLTIEY